MKNELDGWIDGRSIVPNDERPVLVLEQSEIPPVLLYGIGMLVGGRWADHATGKCIEVVYWRPLPKKPRLSKH